MAAGSALLHTTLERYAASDLTCTGGRFLFAAISEL